METLCDDVLTNTSPPESSLGAPVFATTGAHKISRAVSLGERVALGDNIAVIKGHSDLTRTAFGIRPSGLSPAALHDCPRSSRDALASLALQPAGVRLHIRTAATRIALSVMCTAWREPDRPVPVKATFLLTSRGRELGSTTVAVGRVMTEDPISGTIRDIRRAPLTSTVRFDNLPGHKKDLEIWLPHNVTVDIVSLEANAQVEPGTTRARPVWVHHGGTLSHARHLSRPTDAWPAVTSRLAGLDLVNLSLDGQCHLDAFAAAEIARRPASLITLEIGADVVAQRSMSRRTLEAAADRFISRIRSDHPETPLLVMSPLHSGAADRLPGPTRMRSAEGTRTRIYLGDPRDVAQGALSHEAVREILCGLVVARQATDAAIGYIDGRALLGAGDTAESLAPDPLQPPATVHRSIGLRLAHLLADDLGLIAMPQYPQRESLQMAAS